MLDFFMNFLAAFALVLFGINTAYALFSNGPNRIMMLVRGLICGYIGIIYLAYLEGKIPEPIWMRHLMRGAIFVILVLFLLDTITAWRKKVHD